MSLGFGLGLTDIPVLRTGGGGGAPPAPELVHKGSAEVYNSGSGAGSVTVAGVALSTGSTLVVVLGYSQTSQIGASAVAWGGNTLTRRVAQAFGGSSDRWVEIWTLDNVTGGTNDVVATVGASTPSGVILVGEALNVATAPTDQTASSSGSGTSPVTGTTPTTTQASELLVAAIGTRGPIIETAGTWGDSFTGLARQGNADQPFGEVTLDYAQRVVASTGTYQGSKTGITSQAWGGVILTLKGL